MLRKEELDDSEFSHAAMRSESPVEVAAALSNRMIETIRITPQYGGRKVADFLTRLRDHMWNIPPHPSNPLYDRILEDKKLDAAHLYHQIFSELKTTSEKIHLMEGFARLGHLYEIAGLVARDNTFRNLRESGASTPGSTTEFIRQVGNAEKAVKLLNQPVFEMVMTAHPTNVNSPELITALRALGNEIERIRDGIINNTSMHKLVEDFLKAPLVPQKDGKPVALTVHDETAQMLYYLENCYKDLPRLYRKFDTPLQAKGGYDPLQLKLNLRFSSWGSSGDKDGNNKVNADTTLEAIAMHKHTILRLYLEDLQKVNHTYPELSKWQITLKSSLQKLGNALALMAEERERGHHLPPETLDELSRQINEAMLYNGRPFSIEEYVADLEKAYRGAIERCKTRRNKSPSQQKQDSNDQELLLSLLRAARTFGFRFAHIEYRETSAEYTSVVETIIPGYKELNVQDRIERLTGLIQHPQEARDLVNACRKNMYSNGVGKPISPDGSDPWPLVYHTIKRMELARDHPKMIENNVLAECTSADKLLEALFLQVASGTPEKRAELGIVPLFEDPETVQHVGDIMSTVYSNEAYKQHLSLLAQKRGENSQQVQQVQIAHSDNARRSGLPAARALIANAHRILRQTGKKYGIRTQFFEGGSQSDPYRGGVRALTSTVNEFQLYDFSKFTFQGGDMLNYMNYSPSTVRLFTRAIVHSAQHLGAPNKDRRTKKINDTAEEVACRALIKTLPHYQQEWFTDESLGSLLRHAGMGYARGSVAGTIGSRASKRGTGVVSVKNMRTISFSEGLQHAGLVPTWLATGNVGQLLEGTVREKLNELQQSGHSLSQDEQRFCEAAKQHLKKPENYEIAPELLNYFYKNSPTFKDVMDRAAYGIAMFNIVSFKHYNPHISDINEIQKIKPAAVREAASEFPEVFAQEKKLYFEKKKQQDDLERRGMENKPAEAEKLYTDRKQAYHTIHQLDNEYEAAARLAYGAMTGQYPTRHFPQALHSSNILMQLTAEKLPHLYDTFSHKSRYMDFIQSAIAASRDAPVNEKYDRTLHVAGDIATHGRILGGDDPLYGKVLAERLTGRNGKTHAEKLNSQRNLGLSL